MKTLPPSWAGNGAKHHRDVGPFRIQVRRHCGRYVWSILVGRTLTTIASADHLDAGNAADARNEGTRRLAVIAVEIQATLAADLFADREFVNDYIAALNEGRS